VSSVATCVVVGVSRACRSRKFKFTRIKIVVRKALAASEAWLERSCLFTTTNTSTRPNFRWPAKSCRLRSRFVQPASPFILVDSPDSSRLPVAQSMPTKFGRLISRKTHPMKMPTAYIDALLVTHTIAICHCTGSHRCLALRWCCMISTTP
jgi:hypothetical protein